MSQFINNNPGNIRYNPSFKGVIGKDSRGFSIFKNHLYGIRAIRVLLTTYINKYNLRTINKIINRYAPSSDNNRPLAYAKYVSDKSGIPVNQIIRTTDIDKLLPAIIKMETGKVVDPNDIYKSYNPAGAPAPGSANKFSFIPAALIGIAIFLLNKLKGR